MLSLRVGDVRFDRYGAIVTISGKTGDRAVRLVASSPAPATWLEHHPHRDDPKAPLWVNLGYKFRGTGITYVGLTKVIKRLAELAGIKKRVHLHGFRHSAATRLARLLTEAEIKQYFGWVQNSKMAIVYVHLTSRDVDKSLLRVHGLLTGLREIPYGLPQLLPEIRAGTPKVRRSEQAGLGPTDRSNLQIIKTNLRITTNYLTFCREL